jgi:hypothetical protein
MDYLDGDLQELLDYLRTKIGLIGELAERVGTIEKNLDREIK